MNKAELTEAIARKVNISKSKAQETLNAAFEAIRGSLKRGQRVQLVGFGSFLVRNRKARQGRNPKTGETIQIRAKKVPAWTPSADFKKALN